MLGTFFKRKDSRKLTAVLIDLRDTDSFKIVDFEDLFSFFDYLEFESINTIKFYNYDPKEGRIIITFPIKLSHQTPSKTVAQKPF